MLLRNLNPKQSLCNGTRLCITGLKNNVIKAEITMDSKIIRAHEIIRVKKIPNAV